MKALLVAAGLGTRLRPITYKIPKCLVPIHGKPLLGYWIERLVEQGIEHIYINTHYLAEAVEAYVGSHPLRNHITLVYEERLLGTGGTLKKLGALLGGQAFLFAHADNLTKFELASFIEAHQARGEGVEITMMTFLTDTPHACGIVEWNQDRRVTAFYEKVVDPPGNHANAAVYLLEPSVHHFLSLIPKEVIDFSTEVLPHYLHRMQVFSNSTYHRDIGSLKSLYLAEQEFAYD